MKGALSAPLALALGLLAQTASAGVLQRLGLWDGPRRAVQALASKHGSHFVTEEGKVYAAGENSYSRLGVSTGFYDSEPSLVRLRASEVKQVASSFEHTLFLIEGGMVLRMGSQPCHLCPPFPEPKCPDWDSTVCGWVISGSTTIHPEDHCRQFAANETCKPLLVQGLGAVKAVAAASWNSFFVMEGGQLWAMGFNEFGQLGTGDKAPRTAPVQILGLGAVRQVSACDNHTLFMLEGGEVYAAGTNDKGQLGTGDSSDALTPAKVEVGFVKQVAACEGLSLFLNFHGAVFAAGRVWPGGPDLADESGKPGLVSDLPPVKFVACGRHKAFFVTEEKGRLFAMGDESSFLGVPGGQTVQPTPVEVPDLPDRVEEVSAGWDHSLLLMKHGSVLTMGKNDHNQLGAGPNARFREERPVPVQGFTPAWTPLGILVDLVALFSAVGLAALACCWCKGGGASKGGRRRLLKDSGGE